MSEFERIIAHALLRHVMEGLLCFMQRVRERERETMGRRRGASVLYVQREFEHVFHLNICT